jgi:MFS family permease
LSRSGERPPVSSLLYFAAIGLGFLMLEIVLIQRFVLFLGFPTYAISIVLFALLIFTGVGSAISTRVSPARGTLTAVLGVALALVLAATFALQPLLEGLIDLPFLARVMLAVALLAPLGLALGMPMPLGLARFSSLFPRSVAYAWGVNGMASVLATVAAIAIAINFGYTAASLGAGACYAFALAHAALGRWPAPARVQESVGEPPRDPEPTLAEPAGG